MALTDAVRPAQAQAQAPSPSPSPSPLPSTSSLAIPSTPSRKDRRRSWFGLVTPTRKDKAQAQQRSVSATAALPAAQEDEVEELDATPQRRSAEESRRAWPSRTVSGSSGNSVGTAHTARNARTARALSYESDSDREVINLDTGDEWEGTGTVRRKQTMRQQRQAAQDAFKTASISTTPTAPAPSALPPPPPRQRDLATLAILSQNNAPVKTRMGFSSRRIFSRSAADTTAAAGSSATASATALDGPTTQRASPISDTRFMSSTPVLSSVPLFIEDSPVNKPLPQLPPRDDNSFETAESQMPASPPLPPTDIVVTPSSPLDKDHFSLPFARDAWPSSAPPPSPRDAAQNGTQLARQESPTPPPKQPMSVIGLGLPEGHPRRLSARPGPIAVSSPLPRSASPANPNSKVTFATKQGSHEFDSSKVKAPRPRSFSAMFSRSPLLNLDQTDDDEPGPSKFGWLGVRKTIRRRRSELKLNQQKSPEPQATPQEPTPQEVALSKLTNNSSARVPSSNAPSEMSITTATVGPKPGPLQDPTTPALSSFTLPPVEHEEWWPTKEWSDTRDGRDTYSPATPPVHTPTEEREDTFTETESRDSISSSRRMPGGSSLSLLSVSGGLGSLPEGGVAPSVTPTVPPIAEQPTPSVPPTVPAAVEARRTHNRRRSYSDASHGPPIARTEKAQPHSLNNSPRPNFLATLAGDTGRAPSRLSRPPSSSSTFIKMRSVFTMGGRSRSNSALRFDREDGRDSPHARPGSSASAASSFVPSPALPPVRIRPEDVPQVSQLQLITGTEQDMRVVLTETPDRSPRSSIASSMRRASQTNIRSNTAEPVATGGLRATRARASTISSGAISWQGTFGLVTHHSNHSATGTFGHPPSVYANSTMAQTGHGSSTHLPIPTPTFPTSSTPPRRPGSIRRLSTGLFRSSSPKPGIIRSGSGSVGLPNAGDDFSPRDSVFGESRSGSALGMATMPVPDIPGIRGLDKKDVDTTVHEDDTPEAWLARVLAISRRQLSTVLAQSSETFHMDALRLYMKRFDFHHTGLDVALRRLLMDLSLPKETQQIDRVVETFAARYDACEPGLFGSKDNTYILAFSMMMLHTDAFNRHNKNKMTKADYVRNTRLDGIPETVLEAFFDNITFTPFVFIEDDNEASLAVVGATVPSGPVRPGKVDVYDMIAGGTLTTLRANVEPLIPPESPYSCMGTQAFLDVDQLQRCFADAHPLSFVKSRPRRMSSVTMPGLPGVGDKPVPKEEIHSIKVTKVGLMMRKDDTPVNGKRPTGRKWKNWSVILTGSQLLFFKDTILALTLVEQIRNAATSGVRMTGFQPDEVLSVKDCVAIWDRDYYDGAFTFRFIMPGGYQFLMQTLDEKEMNEWLTLINYASTFKSAGIRMRATAIDSGDAKLAGTAAAESHVKDLETGTPSPKVSTPPPQARSVFFTQPSAFEEPPMVRPKLRRVGSLRSAPTPRVDIAGANDVVVGGGEQIEAVIGSVKAELAAGRGAARPLSMDPGAQASTPPLHKSLRTEAIQDRVTKLRNSAGVIERRLATNLRIARNLALLTPFQRVTRDRIEAAVPDLANQIRADRIDLAKLHLWITMLLKDQERDEREWARVRHVALQAAAKSLRTGLTVADRRATLAHPITIPKLSLPPDSEEQLWGAGTNAAGEADRDAEDGAITATPVSSGLASPFTPGLMSPLAVVRGDSSSSELLISTDLSGSHSASGAPSNASNANSNVSTPDVAPDSAEPSSARTSSGSGSSEYELASEYLSAESRLSLHDELERHFAPDSPALSSLGSSLGSISGSGMSIGMRNGTVVKVHNGSANVNVNGGAGAGANGNAHVRLVSPDDREERLDDEADDDDEERDTVSPSTLAKKPPTATEERAEHWRHTRAATKVSLARMPRKSLDEIQARITHGQGHGHGHGSG